MAVLSKPLHEQIAACRTTIDEGPMHDFESIAGPDPSYHYAVPLEDLLPAPIKTSPRLRRALVPYFLSTRFDILLDVDFGVHEIPVLLMNNTLAVMGRWLRSLRAHERPHLKGIKLQFTVSTAQLDLAEQFLADQLQLCWSIDFVTDRVSLANDEDKVMAVLKLRFLSV